MRKGNRVMVLPLIILGIIIAWGEAVTSERVSLGSISIEAPPGWSLSSDGKRIIGKPAASDKASAKEWYALGSELFVIVGPEADSGQEMTATLKKFMEDTYIGYAEIELKSLKLKVPGGIENLGLGGSIRNRSSGDILYAVVMVIRYKGSRYFLVYDVGREDRFRDFSQNTMAQIMDSLKTCEGSAKSGDK